MSKKILLIASGGGHTGFALAVGTRIRELSPKADITYIVPCGDTWSINRILRVDPKANIREVTKPLKPLEPYTRLFKRVLHAFIDSIREVEHAIVFCTGSNHNIFPVLISRYLRRSIVFCVEDTFRFKRRSRTLDLLYRVANVNVFLQWPEQVELYRGRGIYAGLLYEKPMHSVRDEGYILVTTGTMGNRSLFKLLAKIRLDNLVVQTGAINPDLLKRRGWKVFRFDPDIDKLIAGASLVITSAPGVTAINATQAYRKPTIMVYNPDLVLTADREETEKVAKYLGIPFVDPRVITPRDFEKIVYEAYNIKPRVVRNGGYFIAKYLLNYIKA